MEACSGRRRGKPDGYEVYIYNTIKIDDEGEEEDVESLYIGYVPTGSSATVNASTQAGLYRIAGEETLRNGTIALGLQARRKASLE